MVKEILVYPTNKDILLKKSEDVNIENITNEETQQLIQDLKDTLNNSTGVGISAVQIGVLKKICIIKHNHTEYVIINPKITKSRGSILSNEGCLSAPDTYTKTLRAQKIWFDYYDETGRKRVADEGGLFSIIAQHEFDHFDGGCVVFTQMDKNEKLAIQMTEAIKNGEVQEKGESDE